MKKEKVEKVEKIVNKDGKVKVYLEESNHHNPFLLPKNHKAIRNEDKEAFYVGEFMVSRIDEDEN